MTIYECVAEALDYGKNPNAVEDLKKRLSTFPDIEITDTIIEEGDPIKDGAGAGVIFKIPEDKYKETNTKYREEAAKVYGCDPMYYRLGLSISRKINK